MNEQRINYQIELEKVLENIKNAEAKPRLCLHSCCGPCSSYVLEYLSLYFEITVLYFNPSIYPEKEYQKRISTQKTVLEKTDAAEIKLIVCDYDHESFLKLAKGFENEKEGGSRCEICYAQRLEYAAEFASKNGFDFFCTTLSVSPYKNAGKLNLLGRKFAEKYGVEYLFSDFKKKNGYKRSIELSKEMGLYRQEYCGCEFSLRDMQNQP
ncbi:MAG: epoxyqueuosine reductase QueH [Oscillospiraceae bacterium]|nr:epoxyqueuosine reductase QueH [Oscillospiraceae bacterium]